MAVGHSKQRPSWWSRHRLLLSQVGFKTVAAFGLLCFVAGFWARSSLRLAEPELQRGGRRLQGDPCAGLVADSEPQQAQDRELVLVTGAAGFIGSALVEELLALGYRVRAFDNLETGNLLHLDLVHPRLEFQYGDILDMHALRRAMVGVHGVLHLAAASKVLPSLKSPRMATFNIERNAVGTSNVLEAANETGLVRKVVYAGSSTYYGNQEVPFAESAPFVPSSPYAASKYMGELQMLTSDQLYGLPTLVLRFFMVYGPRNPAEGAYAVVSGRFITRHLAGEALLIEGSGEQFRDFIHVADVARACVLALQSSVRGTVINVGSGRTHTVKQLADMVSPKQEHVAARPHDLKGTLADTCRAKRLLRFSTRRDLAATVRQLLADAKAGRGYYPAEMWEAPGTLEVLQQRFPGWAAMSFAERGGKLRHAVSGDHGFLGELLNEIQSRTSVFRGGAAAS